MSVKERSTVDPQRVAGGFKPVVAQIMKQAICDVMGECSKRPLESYADEIALAAACVQHHFGLDPKEYGVPLVTMHVAGLQLTDRLVDEVDFEDADAFIEYSTRQFDSWLDAKGYPKDDEKRAALWEFTTNQAIAVLAGEFADEAKGGLRITEVQ